MTNQITIKLNKQKYEPLLKFFSKESNKNLRNNSQIVGCALFFIYLYIKEKVKNDKTRREILCELEGISQKEGMFNIFGRFKNFLECDYLLGVDVNVNYEVIQEEKKTDEHLF